MADCFSTIKDRYIAECGVLADPNTSTSARIRAQANHVREAEKKNEYRVLAHRSLEADDWLP